MTRTLLLGIIVSLAALLLLVAIGNGEEQRLAAAVQTNQARHIEHGAQLYAQNCRTCHGVNGEGVGSLGPALNDAHFFSDRLGEVGWNGSLQDYIVTTTAGGRVVATRPLYAGDGAVVMPPWSRQSGGPLRDDQIEALTAFVLNWKATALGDYVISPLPTPSMDTAGDGDPKARGRQTFLDAGCAACHAIATGDDVDGGPILAGIGAAAADRVPGATANEYLRAAVLVPAAHGVAGYEQADPCGGVVTESQLDDLVAYLLSL